MKKTGAVRLLALVAVVLIWASASAMEVTPKLVIEGDLAGVYQYQNIGDAPGYADSGRGAVVFQPAVGIELTENDRIDARFGFAAGNGLNGTAPFMLAPWAADLEADVKGLNGRDRDYLLTAWYQHRFDLTGYGSLAISGGIIDATHYLDQNAYANDEFRQFMNTALVNAPNSFLPSYDRGLAGQWENGNWSAAAVVMSMGQNDDGESFNFFGAQVGYKLQTDMGEGNYRLSVNGTSADFTSPSGDSGRSKQAVFLSCDQQLGDSLGAWMRIGWQADDALIAYKHMVSGGIDISGQRWARAQDNIGIGVALLNGGNSPLDDSKVFEIYYRCAINEIAALSLDLQYILDDYDHNDDPKGLISGLRFAASF